MCETYARGAHRPLTCIGICVMHISKGLAVGAPLPVRVKIYVSAKTTALAQRNINNIKAAQCYSKEALFQAACPALQRRCQCSLMQG